MLNHMQHFVAEAIHILRPRTSPPNHHHGFSHINIRIGYPFIRFTFEHEITGIFERNAAASQIPKIPFRFQSKTFATYISLKSINLKVFTNFNH